MKFSIIIPAHNEADSLPTTISAIATTLESENIDYEIIVVDDHSTDNTSEVLDRISKEKPRCRMVVNDDFPGYGMAVRCGLDQFLGDAVAIVMADASDDPQDILKYYHELETGVDCVFGSRFTKYSKIKDYPMHKLWLNRFVNLGIRLLFWIKLNDTTNAFKAYRRETINGLQPLLSRHFNLTVELPLKAIVRGFTYKVVPINWYGRTKGVSKLKLKEMGSRYAFIILYSWLEKLLSRGDYLKSSHAKKICINKGVATEVSPPLDMADN